MNSRELFRAVPALLISVLLCATAYSEGNLDQRIATLLTNLSEIQANEPNREHVLPPFEDFLAENSQSALKERYLSKFNEIVDYRPAQIRATESQIREILSIFIETSSIYIMSFRFNLPSPADDVNSQFDALYQIAAHVATGVGVARDEATYDRLIQEGARRGHALSQSALCSRIRMRHKPQDWPTADLDGAWFHCQKAAEQGEPSAMYQLALMHLGGHGHAPVNRPLAIRILQTVERIGGSQAPAATAKLRELGATTAVARSGPPPGPPAAAAPPERNLERGKAIRDIVEAMPEHPSIVRMLDMGERSLRDLGPHPFRHFYTAEAYPFEVDVPIEEQERREGRQLAADAIRQRALATASRLLFLSGCALAHRADPRTREQWSVLGPMFATGAAAMTDPVRHAIAERCERGQHTADEARFSAAQSFERGERHGQALISAEPFAVLKTALDLNLFGAAPKAAADARDSLREVEDIQRRRRDLARQIWNQSSLTDARLENDMYGRLCRNDARWCPLNRMRLAKDSNSLCSLLREYVRRHGSNERPLAADTPTRREVADSREYRLAAWTDACIEDIPEAAPFYSRYQRDTEVRRSALRGCAAAYGTMDSQVVCLGRLEALRASVDSHRVFATLEETNRASLRLPSLAREAIEKARPWLGDEAVTSVLAALPREPADAKGSRGAALAPDAGARGRGASGAAISSAEHQRLFDRQLRANRYPVSVTGVCRDGQVFYTSEFAAFGRAPFAFRAVHGADERTLRRVQADMDRNGFARLFQNETDCGGRTHFHATWVRR